MSSKQSVNKKNWRFIKVADAIMPVKYTNKIPLSKFLSSGTFPIIDQSEKFIAGYWDNPEDVYKVDSPVVAFGDHTRCLKYIDFDFVLGADGVKLLKPIDEYHPKFFYFACQSVEIESLGYSRHYKQLAGKEIPLPPLTEQKQIVAALDKRLAAAEQARQSAKQVLADTKQLSTALLREAFPTGESLPDSWKRVKLEQICDILDNLRVPVKKSDRESGPYPYYGATGILDYVNQYIFDERLVLVGEDGAKWGSGEKTAFIVSGKYWVNNHAHVLRCHKDKALDSWLAHYVNCIDVAIYITGTTVPKLNQEKLRQMLIPLPPLAEQKRIVAKLDKQLAIAEAARQAAERQLSEINLLSNAILRETLTP